MSSPWTVALLRWMKRTKRTKLALALALGVSPSVVHYWCRGAIPRAKMLFAVEKLSRGKVKASLASKAAKKTKLAKAA